MPNTYTQFPNHILGWMVHRAKTKSEVGIVSLIARLSCGFHQRQTHRRLDLDAFASELKCDRSTVSRTVNSLLRRRRIFRFDPQGDHFYYSLYSSRARREGEDATPHDPNATPAAQAAMPNHGTVAAVQQHAGKNERTPSAIKRVTAGVQTANMRPASDNTKKAVKKILKERLKEPSAGSALASAGASASPASNENETSKPSNWKQESFLAIGLSEDGSPKAQQHRDST